MVAPAGKALSSLASCFLGTRSRSLARFPVLFFSSFGPREPSERSVSSRFARGSVWLESRLCQRLGQGLWLAGEGLARVAFLLLPGLLVGGWVKACGLAVLWLAWGSSRMGGVLRRTGFLNWCVGFGAGSESILGLLVLGLGCVSAGLGLSEELSD